MISFCTYFYNDFDNKWDAFVNNFLSSIKDFKDYELLIINNGGKGFDKEKIDVYNLNARILSIEKNVNPGGAKEFAIDNADGEFIWILDSDDFFEFDTNYYNDLDFEKINLIDLTTKVKLDNDLYMSFSVIIPSKLVNDYGNPYRDWKYWCEELPLNKWILSNNIQKYNTKFGKYTYLNDVPRPVSIGRVLGNISSILEILKDEKLYQFDKGKKGWIKYGNKLTFNYLMWMKITRNEFFSRRTDLLPSKFVEFIFFTNIHWLFFSVGRLILSFFGLSKGWRKRRVK